MKNIKRAKIYWVKKYVYNINFASATNCGIPETEKNIQYFYDPAKKDFARSKIHTYWNVIKLIFQTLDQCFD